MSLWEKLGIPVNVSGAITLFFLSLTAYGFIPGIGKKVGVNAGKFRPQFKWFLIPSILCLLAYVSCVPVPCVVWKEGRYVETRNRLEATLESEGNFAKYIKILDEKTKKGEHPIDKFYVSFKELIIGRKMNYADEKYDLDLLQQFGVTNLLCFLEDYNSRHEWQPRIPLP